MSLPHHISLRSTLRTASACAGIAALALPAHAAVLVQPNDLIAVCTDLRPMPKMASQDIEDYFLMCQPIAGARCYESGSGQESVEFFGRRIESDLGPIEPNIVLTSYTFANGRNPAGSRGLTYYDPVYLASAIDKLKKVGIRDIVVGCAYPADSTKFGASSADSASWNTNLALFRDAQHDVATKAGVGFADVFAPMMAAISVGAITFRSFLVWK